MADTPVKPVFIFDSRGDWHATKFGEYLYSSRGEYIGWVEGTANDVFKRDGEWIGRLSKDGRILRKRSERRRELNPSLRKEPTKPKLPPRTPLPPMMSDLDFGTVDVLDEEPDIFKRVSDLRPDMD
jgi:hypothetical protein